MALTPEDVQNVRFTTVRLREGYEQTEVDEFIDLVEAELMRLLQENTTLRSQVAGGTAASPDSADRPVDAPSVSVDKSAAATPPTGRAAPQEIVVRTSGEVSAAAARVLEMAQRTAEMYVEEARTEADKLVVDATAEADRLSTQARSQADDVDRATHERTTALERDLAEQRRATLESLQQEKRRLESEVETLRSFEREYRGRLRTFLESQLDQLSNRGGGDTPLAPADGPVTTPAPDAGTDGEQDVLATAIPDPGVDDSGVAPEEAAAGRRSRSALGRILDEEERDADSS